MPIDDRSRDASALPQIKERIKELGDKSGQTLLFPSFALVVAATLKEKVAPGHQAGLKIAMYSWSIALLPAALGIPPLKEFRENDLHWYRLVRCIKVVLLWFAVIFIMVGAVAFIMPLAEVFSN